MVNVGVILVISLTGYLLFVNRSDQSLIDDSIIAGPISPDELERGTPDYPTLIPAGVDIEAQGGWARISPEGRDPVYAFVDRIDDVSISISQQPLPEEFKQNTADRIERLARDFGATEKITVGNTTVYIGSTAEGPQSIIFSRKDLLILIKSSGRVSNEQWSSYIASFE